MFKITAFLLSRCSAICKGWHVSHIWEDTYMPVSSHEEVRLGPIKLV